jgi:hypothetical protein
LRPAPGVTDDFVLMQLDGLGFCGFGEAKDVICQGNLPPVRSIPRDTSGGLQYDSSDAERSTSSLTRGSVGLATTQLREIQHKE